MKYFLILFLASCSTAVKTNQFFERAPMSVGGGHMDIFCRSKSTNLFSINLNNRFIAVDQVDRSENNFFAQKYMKNSEKFLVSFVAKKSVNTKGCDLQFKNDAENVVISLDSSTAFEDTKTGLDALTGWLLDGGEQVPLTCAVMSSRFLNTYKSGDCSEQDPKSGFYGERKPIQRVLANSDLTDNETSLTILYYHPEDVQEYYASPPKKVDPNLFYFTSQAGNKEVCLAKTVIDWVGKSENRPEKIPLRSFSWVACSKGNSNLCDKTVKECRRDTDLNFVQGQSNAGENLVLQYLQLNVK